MEIFFNFNGVKSHIETDYDFQKQYLKIKNAVFKSGKKEIKISGGIEKLLKPDELKFDVDVNGSRGLFNKIFMSGLHKNKTTVFDKENVNLKILGNLVSFQVIN